MMPGLGGLNPKKMEGMMKKMGISQESIEGVKRVVIEREEGNIVFENPQVMKIGMQGNETWQVMGDAVEEESSGIRGDDVKLVAEKTGKSEEEARKALEDANGDIAEAIIKLSG